MVKGIGVDIIDVSRIQKMADKGVHYISTVFTQNEIAYAEERHRKAEHYAGRFAAKEAFFKAMGTGWRDGMKWTEIDVQNDELGKPFITLSGKTLENFKKNNFSTITLSISHTRENAVAFVIIE